jgi:hypothetical protein
MSMEGKIIGLFDEAQRSETNHKNLSNKLLFFVNKNPGLLTLIHQLYDKILSYSKKEPVVDRIVRFYCLFVQTTASNENLFALNMRYLLRRSESIDKNVRFRACETIYGVFSGMTEELEMEEILWLEILAYLLPRLRDKCPTVRLWAVRAVKDFQDPLKGDDIVMGEYKRLLQSDTSKDIRVAVLEVISVCMQTLTQILDRLRDVKSEVRLAAVNQILKSVEVNHLLPKQIAAFVKYGLNDRDEQVNAASFAVIVKWLKKLNGNPSRLLRLVGLKQNGEEAEQLSWRIIYESQKSESLFGSSLLRENTLNWSHLSFIDLSPSDVLWTLSRCSYVHTQYDSVKATELLEMYLPDTIILCRFLQEGLVALQVGRNDSSDVKSELMVAHTQSHELCLLYLIRLALFIDTDDVAGCQQLGKLTDLFLAESDFPESMVSPLLFAYSRTMAAIDEDIVDPLIAITQQVQYILITYLLLSLFFTCFFLLFSCRCGLQSHMRRTGNRSMSPRGNSEDFK